jgi:hypothetical protein
MDILQNLLENEILTSETKDELEKAIETQISEAVEAAVLEAKAEVETSVRAELAEQFVTDKEALVEALDTKAQQFLESELAELKDDVDNFRDLEAEFALKVVNMKKELSEVAKKDFAQLVNILNEFLEERVTAEFEELKEDIDEVKKIRFGQKIYESVKAEFEREHFDKDEIDKKAGEVKAELEKTKEQLKEATTKLNATEREFVLTETLSALEGRPREVMAAILQRTPTGKIKKVYEQFIGRVLNENVVAEDTEKEAKVLAEDSKTQDKEKVVTETVKVSGDAGKEPIVESEEDTRPRLSKEAAHALRELSGHYDK